MTKIVKNKMASPWVHDIQPTIEAVSLGSEGDLHKLHDNLMKFYYSSWKAVKKSPDMVEILKLYRLILAHLDRRWLCSMFISQLPHELRPTEFGLASTCAWCSQITLNDKSRKMLNDLKRNNGVFFSPSVDPANTDHYRTFLQEMWRLRTAESGSTPDELLPIPEERLKGGSATQHPLFPEVRKCPHLGCYSFYFKSSSDSLAHEKLMHPGQRKQRLIDRAATAKGLPQRERKFPCGQEDCPLKFSTLSAKLVHQDAYFHRSVRSRSLQKTKRQDSSGRPPPPNQHQGNRRHCERGENLWREG